MTLPNFIICGTQKGGTTSLHWYLKDHPEIFMADTKEVHFFDRNYEKGMKWYKDFFKKASSYKLIGEATPSYMYLEEVAGRIHKQLPKAKLIFVLRDPINRAYSAYWHMRRNGGEKISFEKALEKEEKRLAQDAQVKTSAIAYKARGRYAEQLKRYLALFPRKQILILTTKELEEEPVATLNKIGTFLGVKQKFTKKPSYRIGAGMQPRKITGSFVAKRLLHFPRSRLGKVIFAHLPKGFKEWMRIFLFKKDYPSMKKSTEEKLSLYFAPYKKELEVLLDRKFPWK